MVKVDAAQFRRKTSNAQRPTPNGVSDATLTSAFDHWTLGVGRFLSEYGAGRADSPNHPCTWPPILRLVHATGAVPSRARILFFGPLRYWTERRLFHERECRPVVWAIVGRAVHR